MTESPEQEYSFQDLQDSAIELEMLRNSIIADMMAIFYEDKKRIKHAMSVLAFAEDILETEKADSVIVISAAILHDIGIHEAEAKHNSSAGKYQEIEGPPIAREILEDYDLTESQVDHVCRIIANHHSAKDIDTREFRIVWDADRIVNMQEEDIDLDIEKVFKTNGGKTIAVKLFSQGK